MEAGSAVLQLPKSVEESMPVEGDHSSMVKFKHKDRGTYLVVLGHLKGNLH